MKKIILHVNDDKVEFIKELLSHFYFVRIAEQERPEVSHNRYENRSDSGLDDDKSEENKSNYAFESDKEMPDLDVRNLKQLRDALNLIDSIRDKNKH